MMWQDLGVDVKNRISGQIKTYCPKCHNKRSDKRDASLSCNLDTGAYKCHYCEWSGNINSNPAKTYFKPEWKNNTSVPDHVVKWFEGRGINQSTLLKARVTYGNEYMPQKGSEVGTIQFNYFINNELVNVKYRTLDKNFKLVSNAELVPYNIDSIHKEKTCVITEGEIDCLSFIQCGFASVISVPNGATSNLDYLDRFIESHFEDKEEIFIAVDTDKKGLDLRNELVRRLGAERCRIVTYVEGCKDINEVLSKPGHGSTAVLQAIEDAQYVKIEGVFEVSDVRSQLDMLFNEGLQKGATIGHPHFDDLISWVTGRLCVVTGIPSHGKSEFLDEIVYRLNLKHKWRVAYFSPENHPLEWHISKVVSKLTGKKFEKDKLSHEEYKKSVNYTNDNYFFIAPMDSSDIDTILEKAASLVRRKGIKMLVIDPYNKLEHNLPKGLNETQYISLFLDRLISFARKYNILCFLVAHPVKMKVEDGLYEVPNLYSISGSSHFFNKTDYGISVYRNFVTNTVEVYVQKVKFRHLGKPGVSNFHYNLENGRYVQAYEDQSPEWTNENHLTKQLFNDRINQEDPKIDFDDGDLPM